MVDRRLCCPEYLCLLVAERRMTGAIHNGVTTLVFTDQVHTHAVRPYALVVKHVQPLSGKELVIAKGNGVVREGDPVVAVSPQEP